MFISLKTPKSFWSINFISLSLSHSGSFFSFCFALSAHAMISIHTVSGCLCLYWCRLFLISRTCHQHIWSNAMASDQTENPVFASITAVAVVEWWWRWFRIFQCQAQIFHFHHSSMCVCVLFHLPISSHVTRACMCIWVVHYSFGSNTKTEENMKKFEKKKFQHRHTRMYTHTFVFDYVWLLTTSNSYGIGFFFFVFFFCLLVDSLLSIYVLIASRTTSKNDEKEQRHTLVNV